MRHIDGGSYALAWNECISAKFKRAGQHTHPRIFNVAASNSNIGQHWDGVFKSEIGLHAAVVRKTQLILDGHIADGAASKVLAPNASTNVDAKKIGLRGATAQECYWCDN